MSKVLIILCFWTSAFKLSSGIDVALDETKIPQTTLKELTDYLSGKRNIQNFLQDVGGKVGVFSVNGLGQRYLTAIENFRRAAPECLENLDTNLPVAEMTDGSLRRTYATEDNYYPGCLAQPMKTVSEVFDVVESKVVELIEKRSGVNDLGYLEDKVRVPLQDAPKKDHIHVYVQNEGSNNDQQSNFLVPFHIDNGLFLLLTPFPSPSLSVKLSNGEIVSTQSIKPDSVLVLMGRGLTEWLVDDQKTLFYAVPHAVPSLAGSDVSERAILARMKVAPKNAIPAFSHNSPPRPRTFGEIFFDTAPTVRTGSAENLCTGSTLEKRDTKDQTPLSVAKFFQANSKNCENGTAYCWMNCLPLPPGCDTDESVCYNKNEKPCNTVDDQGPHDATCAWHCKKPDEDDKFCAGGMDMLMGGFEVVGGSSSNRTRTCVILFFASWKLNSAGKFVAACVGVFILGFSIEAIIFLRRKIMNKKRFVFDVSLPVRKIIVISLFGVNLILGYLAMLVAMTYSVELFICVVAGLITGHALFNSKMPVGETIDPCCASQNNASGDRSPITRTPCDNAVYDEIADGPGANQPLNEPDGRPLCHCEDSSSNVHA